MKKWSQIQDTGHPQIMAWDEMCGLPWQRCNQDSTVASNKLKYQIPGSEEWWYNNLLRHEILKMKRIC